MINDNYECNGQIELMDYIRAATTNVDRIKAQHLLDRESGSKPKFNKGKHISDFYKCGNCGCRLHDIIDNWCWNCGYKILWDNPRCLTK